MTGQACAPQTALNANHSPKRLPVTIATLATLLFLLQSLLFAESRQILPTGESLSWRPISEHSAVTDTTVFKWDFSDHKQWRVGWDLALNADFSETREIRLTLEEKAESGCRVLLYFKSGDGYYARSFGIPQGTSDVTLRPARFEIEGEPAGWQTIDGIRICVLREPGLDGELTLHSLGVETQPTRVAVWYNVGGIKEEPGVPSYVERASRALERLSLGHEILTDHQVAAGGLEGKGVVLLPLNPILPEDCIEPLNQFVGSGGKLIVCYQLPHPLGELLGIELGKVAYKKEGADLDGISLQLSGSRAQLARQNSWIAHTIKPQPQTRIVGTWTDASGNPTGSAAVSMNDNGFFVGHVLTGEDSDAKDALLFTMLASLDKKIEKLAAARNENTQDEATRKLPAKPGEFRAVWCHDPTGAAGMGWEESLALLAENGFTAVFPNLLWGGNAAYATDKLPASRVVASGGDQLEACLEAAQKTGIQVHVWKVNWNLWYGLEPEILRKLEAEGRLQKDLKGNTIHWLCPSDPRNRDQEAAAMIELASDPRVSGIHFDYIRYRGYDGCYCDRCRRQLSGIIGDPLENWPQCVLDGGKHREAFLQFRRDNITALVAKVSQEARAVRPEIQISAAVFSHWPSARDEIAQDWKLWLEQGYLDFVCPMHYTSIDVDFTHRTVRSVRWAGDPKRVVPGIGATLGLTPEDTAEQIRTTREAGTKGFILFDYDETLARKHLPRL
jgi:uncharacterized lipoprotein YddW (UPF0748 family)